MGSVRYLGVRGKGPEVSRGRMVDAIRPGSEGRKMLREVVGFGRGVLYRNDPVLIRISLTFGGNQQSNLKR